MTSSPRVIDGGLRSLEALQCDSIGLFSFSDVRPLRGVLGFVDWRLCGKISRLLLSGQFRGDRGETMLLPAARRLGAQRLFVFGLGRLADATEQVFREAVQCAADVMEKAQAKPLVLAAPAAFLDTRVEEAFLEVLSSSAVVRPDMVLVEGATAPRASHRGSSAARLAEQNPSF